MHAGVILQAIATLGKSCELFVVTVDCVDRVDHVDRLTQSSRQG